MTLRSLYELVNLVRPAVPTGRHLIVLAAGVSLLTSMSVASAETEPAEKITYDDHVLPLLREKCGSCHNSNDKKGDLVLDSYSAVMTGGASGAVVATDGDADGSQLYRVVAHLAEPVMPPNQPKLPDEQLSLLKRWIEGGALENSGSKARKKKKSLSVARVEISQSRPEGPPPFPENLPLDPVQVNARPNAVNALAVSPWAPLAAVAGHRQVLLYDTRDLELVGVLPFPEGQANVLKFTRNGSALLAGGGRGGQVGKAVLWDIRTGQRIAEVGAEYDAVLAADISPDQTLIALGGPKRVVRVYSTETGDLVYEKTKHTDWITALEFSPDGVLLATADRSNGLIVWEAVTGREFYVLNGHTGAISDVSWSPDSNLLATASEDTTIRLWEMQNGGQVRSWGAHGGGCQAVEFTRDSRIVSHGRDQVPRLWDLNGNKQRDFAAQADLGMEITYDAETDRVLAGDLRGTIAVMLGADGSALGTLTTNPSTLADRIQAATAIAAAAGQQAEAAALAVAALEKAIADRVAGGGETATVEEQQQLAAAQAVAATTAAMSQQANSRLQKLTAAVGRQLAM